MSRWIAASLTLLALPAGVVVLTAWLARAHAPDPAPARAVAARLPAPDLALAGGARHLRMPSLEERWAPFEDSPGLLDVDPAGGFFYPGTLAP